jgi:hypothetical protein
MIGKKVFDERMKVLADAHGWKLSAASVDEFYKHIQKANPDDFDQTYRAAIGFPGDYYTAGKFVGALRAAIVERSRKSSNQPRLSSSSEYAPCPDSIAKLNKHVKYIQSLRAQGLDWRAPQFRDLNKAWSQTLRSPLTEEEMLAAAGRSVSDLLTGLFGSVSYDQKANEETEWTDSEDWNIDF